MKNRVQLLMKSVAALMLAMFLVVPAFSQILKEGTLPSIKYNVPDTKDVVDVPVSINWEQVHKEDAINAENKLPMRGGFSIEVGKSINDFGEWMRLPDGRMLWRATLRAEGAQSLGVVFHNFQLPEGAELWTYNENKAMINGALGMHNNHESKLLSTRVLFGNTITIEYIETPTGRNTKLSPSNSGSVLDNLSITDAGAISNIDSKEYKSNVDLIISELIYIYQDNYSVFDNSKPANGASAACQIDIKCSPVGDPHVDTRRGVAHTLNRIGASWYYCSGTLINNTLENWTPYFYTAFHCGDGASVADRNAWQFYFNYERSACGSGTYYTSDVMTGCTLRAVDPISGGADLLLVELNNSVPESYNPFFNGWNRQDVGSPSGASIHHPAGDAKKISTYTATLTSATPNISGSVFATNAAWRVVWSSNANGWGVTAGGSSGSPIFNNNQLVVGDLSGGSSECTAQTSADFYGKLAYQWDTKPNADQKLRPWLDPVGTNPNTHRGWDPKWTTDPPVANFSATPTSGPSGTTFQFTDLSTNGPNEWLWTFGPNAYPETSTERNPTVTWVTTGNYTVSLTATNAYGNNTNTKNNYITVTAPPALPTPNPKIIGTGTNTSLYPFGIDGRVAGAANHVQSVSLYTAAEVGGGGLISTLEWQANTAQADTRNIQIWLKHTSATTLTAGVFGNYTTGATMVYNGTFNPTPAGWVPINLTSSFIYNGTQNLLVIVYVNSASTANISSACRYTTAASRHHRWNARNAAPTGNGTVDGNRPNIRMTFAPNTAPVADFNAVIPTVIYEEGFDGTWLPDGWTVQNFHATHNWQQGNPAANPYSNINPESTSSAIIPWQASTANSQNEWIISPEINTAAYAGRPMRIRFHAGFSRSWLNPGATMSFKISTNNGGTWTELWNAIGDATDPAGVDWAWRLIDRNLASYAGQNVKFAWQYIGNDGDLMGLDGVSLYLDEIPASVEIFEGETVTFADATTGNPLVWKWTANGAVPSTSILQNPTMTYNVAGQYTVALKAGNLAGENTRTKNNYVTVIGRAPLADWWYSSSFWTSGYRPFLQAGDAINYYDLSSRVPTNWAWTFNGGSPASSSSRNPSNIVYNNYGTYNTSLTASNAHGSDVATATGFVIVGGQQEITKILPGETLTYYDTGVANNQFPGHNQWSITAYADKYETTHNGTITQFRVRTPIAVGTGKNVIFRVWADNAGVPGAILGSKTVGIPTLSTTEWNTIVFDSPISTTGTFYVGYVITYDATHNFTTHQCVVSCVPSRESGYNTAYFLEGTTWFDWTAGIGLNSSLAILPTFEYESLGPVVVPGDVNDDGFINVLDIVWLVSHLNGSTPAGFNIANADVNSDSSVNIADLTALINMILGGAMGELEDVTSEPGYLYLEEGGNISFESDGTLLAIQFEIKSPELEEMNLELLLDTDHKLAFNKEKGLGIIYSMTNTIIPAGVINLLKVDGVDFAQVEWGFAEASNVEHRVVPVYTYNAYEQDATGIEEILSDKLDVSIYPNPSAGNFKINFNLPESAYLELELIDEKGRLVSRSTRIHFSAGAHTIQYTQSISSGLYIVRVTGYDANGRAIGVKHEEKIMIVK